MLFWLPSSQLDKLESKTGLSNGAVWLELAFSFAGGTWPMEIRFGGGGGGWNLPLMDILVLVGSWGFPSPLGFFFFSISVFCLQLEHLPLAQAFKFCAVSRNGIGKISQAL